MKNFRVVALRYNIINLVSTVILSTVFFLQFYFISFVWYLILDDDTVFFLIAWPILLLIAIIALNKGVIKRLIHRETKYHYEANNVNYDEVKDEGTLTAEERKLLPDFKEDRMHKSINFDLKFWGNLDDLGISYKIDEFFCRYTKTVGYGKHKRTEAIFNYKGTALIIDFDKEYFLSENIIFINKPMRFSITRAINFEYPNGVELPFGYLLYDDELDNDTLQKIQNTVESNEEIFNTKSRVMSIFHNNRMIILNDLDHKFKIRVPFLISKNTIESLLSNQKGNIYRFNMLLNKVAVIFE